MKRKRAARDGGSVTGGTGDVKPQYLTINTATAAGADDYATGSITVPIIRPSSNTPDQAVIVELLEADYYINIADAADSTAHRGAFLNTHATRVTSDTATLASLALDAQDPTNVGMVTEHGVLTTSGHMLKLYPHKYDFTDQNGNGMLIASDSIILTVGEVGNTASGVSTCRIKYRFVKVGIIEYLGIVAQQQ